MRKLGIIGNSNNIANSIHKLGIAGTDIPKGIILETPEATKDWAKKMKAVAFLSPDMLVDYADALVLLENNKKNLQTAIDFIKNNKLVYFDSIAFPLCEQMRNLLRISHEGNDLISLNNHKWSEAIIQETDRYFTSPLLGKLELTVNRKELVHTKLHEELVDLLEFILSIYKGGIKKVRSSGMHRGNNEDILHIHIETHNGSLIFVEVKAGDCLCLTGELSEPGSSAKFQIHEGRAEFESNDSKRVHNTLGAPNHKHFNSSLEKESFHHIGLEDLYQLNFIAREILESFHKI